MSFDSNIENSISTGLNNSTGSIPYFWDPDALLYFDAVVSQGSVVSDTYKIYYNETIIALKSASIWNNLDSLQIYATGNRIWASIDVKNPSRIATINNPYAGDFTAGTGFKGNGTNFSILTNYNPGGVGTFNYTQNSASYGILLLENNSTPNNWDAGVANAGFTQGALIRCYSTGSPADGSGSINSAFFAAASYKKPVINSYTWISWNRTSSTNANNFLNGVNIETVTASSTALENNSFGLLGAYNGSFAGGFYSSNRIGCFYAGNGNIAQKTIINILNANLFVPQSTKAAINKRIIFEGDSRTADRDLPSLSNVWQYPKKTLSNLGNNWSGAAVSRANDTLQQIITQYSTEILPYRNTSLSRDVVVIWAGTNDIAGGRSATQVYDDMVTFCTQAKADGFFVVVVGEIDRNWTSYAAMNAVRASYRSSLLAAFPNTTIYSNTYTGASWADILIDPYAETNFQSYLSAWYQGDGIHPNSTGSDVIGNYVSNALLL